MPKIVTVEQMRAIEKASDEKGHSYAEMMEMAGRAVAVCAMQHLIGVEDPRVAIIVGPGNNGGDGLVAGRVLVEEIGGINVGAYLLTKRDGRSDPVYNDAKNAGVSIESAEDDEPGAFRVLKQLIDHADMVIDALFGTSLRLPVEGSAAEVLRVVNAEIERRKSERPVLPYITPADPGDAMGDPGPVIIAVDCPSGIDCDTGAMDAHTIPAHETVTFAAAKPGLFTFPGAEAVGTLHIADIGLPAKLPELDGITLTLVDAADAGSRLPERSKDSYKGTFGKALVVGGSLNYTGAPFLAAGSAYRVGAGWVTVGAPQVIVPVLAGMLPEATWILLPHNMGVLVESAVKVLRAELDKYTALLLGPGFGTEDVTGEFLRELLNPQEEVKRSRAIGFVPADADESESAASGALPPLVIDADALNLLSAMENWPDLLPENTILTPHPGEFGRLSGMKIGEIQADRVGAALDKAKEWNCIVVLKGAYTVIANPDGRAAMVPFATSALATAGTGDVLAGAIVGLLAQGVDPFDAAVAGAWLHGLAGVRAEATYENAASVMAGDVLELLPEAYALAEAAR